MTPRRTGAGRRLGLNGAPRRPRLDDALRRAIDVAVAAVGTAVTAPVTIVRSL